MKPYLKPCPFCGSTKIKLAPFRVKTETYTGPVQFYKPVCTDCGIITNDGFKIRDEAIHFWNTRTVRTPKENIIKQ